MMDEISVRISFVVSASSGLAEPPRPHLVIWIGNGQLYEFLSSLQLLLEKLFLELACCFAHLSGLFVSGGAPVQLHQGVMPCITDN